MKAKTRKLPVILTSPTDTAPVTVTAATLRGAGFRCFGSDIPVILNQNQALSLQVQFEPTSAGVATGRLTNTSNSSTGGTVVVQLSGTGTAAQHEIDLSWDAPSSSADPVAGYTIYRSINGGATLTKLNSSIETQLDYVDHAVQRGSTYTYIVKSVDPSGVGSRPSNQVSLRVL
jgi:hypothetical protein